MERPFTNSEDFGRAWNPFRMIVDNFYVMSTKSIGVEVGGANSDWPLTRRRTA